MLESRAIRELCRNGEGSQELSPIQLKSPEQEQCPLEAIVQARLRNRNIMAPTAELEITKERPTQLPMPEWLSTQASIEHQPTEAAEQELTSFDVLASVKMMRFDIDQLGYIRPETLDRVHDEEFSYIAEGIDRHSYTTFNLKNDPEMGLMVFDKGEWRPYKGMLMTGIKAAKADADADGRKHFLVDRALDDLNIGYEMQKLQPGQSMAWYSPFPEKECQAHGASFIRNLGFQPDRRMAFLYRAERHQDGSVTIESHTIDNSDEQILAEVVRKAEQSDDTDMETMRRLNDGHMEAKYGQKFRAGRLVEADRYEENAWEFVVRNKQLFNYYSSKLTELAHSDLQDTELVAAKKELTYSFWATCKELLDYQDSQQLFHPGQPVIYNFRNEQEIAARMHIAFANAVAEGKVMPGCGGSISMTDIANSDPTKVFENIFGKAEKNGDYPDWAGGPVKKGTCVNCKKKNKDVGVESWCKGCIKGHCG